MSLLSPFAYPTGPHDRCHGPKGYKNYGDFKPFLRDEFVFRCVYCLERELWYPNCDGSFSADHFVPKAIDPSRETDYSNLVYACVRCNAFKQTKITFLDPDKVAFADHFRVQEDGHIESLSPEGKDLIELMHLDEHPALSVRQKVLRVLKIKSDHPEDPTIHAHLLDYFAYPPPEKLPNLGRLEPPQGNSRPNGIETCHYARWKSGTLQETY